MVPFFVMLAGILLARAGGAVGWLPVDSWQAATRVGLAVMFVFTATAHFTRTRQDLVRMVPPRLSYPAALVTLTGLCEYAGGLGLLVPSLDRAAAWCLIALLAAMFPANIHAARAGLTIGGRPATPLVLRLPLQLLWIGLLWWSVQS